jgi:hypothetical protein
MASGDAKVRVGSFNSTGALVTIELGWKPRAVMMWGSTASGNWGEDMADDSAYKRVTAGTGSTVTSNGITPTSTGFTVGTDSDLNPSSSVVVHYVAWQ